MMVHGTLYECPFRLAIGARVGQHNHFTMLILSYDDA